MPRAVHRGLLVAVAAAAVACCALLADAREYPLDWNAVPTTSPAAVNTQVKGFGECMCDLTATCDANCCCDPDCTETTKKDAFTTCKRAAAGSNKLVKCGEENGGTEIVRHQQELQYADPVAEDAVCIVTTNLPEDADEFWSAPSNDVSLAAPARPVWPQRDATATPFERYQVGDRIPVIRASLVSGSWSIRPEGYLTDPLPRGRGGRCTSDRVTGFLEGHAFDECAHVGNLSQLCTTAPFSAEAMKFLALTPRTLSLQSSDITPVRHVVRLATTGELVEEIDPTATFQGVLPSRRQAAPSGRPTFTAGVCYNAVVRRSTEVLYESLSSGARITSATITYYVSNVTENTNGVYWAGYETTFRRGDQAADATVPPRQGNPGYVAGRQLLAGRNATRDGKQAVSARVGGLTLPFGRRCSTGHQVGVRFLHNVTESSCGVELSEAQLEQLCNNGTGTEALLRAALQPAGATDPDEYLVNRIGFTANANAAHTNDWVTVDGMPWQRPAAVPTWSRDLRQCTNLVTGLRWVIGVGRAGEWFNPQDLIYRARVQPVYGAWRYRSPGSTQLFRFTFTAEFVRLRAGDRFSRPIVPPSILPEVEEDVFFPFRRGDQGTDN